MMIEPFAFANSTSCSSCCRDAALPVGLFGEQKKIKSVLGVLDRFGKKLFSGLHSMYTIFLYFPFPAFNLPALPAITLESAYPCHHPPLHSLTILLISYNFLFSIKLTWIQKYLPEKLDSARLLTN